MNERRREAYAAVLILGELPTVAVAARFRRRFGAALGPRWRRRAVKTGFAEESAAGAEYKNGLGPEAAAAITVVAGPARLGDVKEMEDGMRLGRIDQVRVDRFGVLRWAAPAQAASPSATARTVLFHIECGIGKLRWESTAYPIALVIGASARQTEEDVAVSYRRSLVMPEQEPQIPSSSRRPRRQPSRRRPRLRETPHLGREARRRLPTSSTLSTTRRRRPLHRPPT